MTDKYEEALQDFEYCVKFIEAIESPYHKNDFMRKTTIETIRHALANCLPELPEGWYIYALFYNPKTTEFECSVHDGDGSLPKHIGHGPTPRAAAQAAIKKIGPKKCSCGQTLGHDDDGANICRFCDAAHKDDGQVGNAEAIKKIEGGER